MTKRHVFYSFHYDNDVMRVQQIRNIGVLEAQPLMYINNWEEIKRGGNRAIQNWIDTNMEGKSCLVVLVGEKTAGREWVNYEIKHAWDKRMGVLGIYIHNIKCPRTGVSRQGDNPFRRFTINDTTPLDSVVTCYNPNPYDAYNDIANKLELLVEDAIRIRGSY